VHVPLELLTAGRDLTEPKISPDGQTVAFVQRWRGAAAIMTVPVQGGAERVLSTGPDPAPGRGMGGGCFDWHPDGTGVVYAAKDGELWWQPIGGRPEPITELERECRAPSTDGSVVVFVIDEAEVWEVQLGSGALRRLDDGADAFCFDPELAPDSSTAVWQGWSPPAMPWDAAHTVTCALVDGTCERWRPEGAAVQQPRSIGAGRTAFVHDASGWLNVYVDDKPVLAEAFEQAGPTWGMGQHSFVLSPDEKRVALCRNERGFGRLVVVERSTGAVTNIGKGGHGQLSWHGTTIVALRTGAVTPTQIVAYDLSDLDVKPPRTVLAVGPADGWQQFELPEPEVIEVDGLFARRYAAGKGKLLAWVHGGPTDQWQADFRPRISYWWSRGWDVLVVDPRGTTGHGRQFQQALNGGWGRLDVDDTAALIAHGHAAGWATPATSVVMGGSSGGLTVLGVLADHADLVAGGVASYPVSDLRALTEVTHRFEAHYCDTLVGEPAVVGWERYDELSPLHRADRIGAPLLLFHGSDDPVVPISQSEAVVEAIRSSGGQVDFVVYEGEGHGFRDSANVRDEYEQTEAFLTALTP
jgi:dipeptidyl aminopeptidase/acylaminoacyl peptidase